MIFYCLILSALIVLVSTLHLKWREGRMAILISSLLLGVLTALMVLVWGSHDCAQGKPPTYLAFVGAALAAAVPWCSSFSMSIRRWLAFTITMLFVTMVGLLVSSYHSEGVTGNPKLASGRYWHTALSGQYPRGAVIGQYEQALMRCMRERLHQLTSPHHSVPETLDENPKVVDDGVELDLHRIVNDQDELSPPSNS